MVFHLINDNYSQPVDKKNSTLLIPTNTFIPDRFIRK